MLKMGITLCVLHLLSSIQMSHQDVDLDMMPNAFDDQYINCGKIIDIEMGKELDKEKKKNKQFSEMWEEASQAWQKKKPGLPLPPNFDDKYGTAVVLYTMERPHPMYRQLNGNIHVYGESKKIYMEKFDLKAFHYYLTRALQLLRTGCAQKSHVYRGMDIGPVSVAQQMRFGQFTSSSKSKKAAKDFGQNPFFSISTCYGVNIKDFSDFEEQEFLIPVGEMFNKMNQIGSTYYLESTGQLCSYFNCAYLKGKRKRKFPVCSSGRQEDNIPSD